MVIDDEATLKGMAKDKSSPSEQSMALCLNWGKSAYENKLHPELFCLSVLVYGAYLFSHIKVNGSSSTWFSIEIRLTSDISCTSDESVQPDVEETGGPGPISVLHAS